MITFGKSAESVDATISNLPGDKSISHRFAIFSLLSNKPSHARNFLRSQDCLHSLEIVQKLGARVSCEDGVLNITPPSVISEPADVLYCGNSGTSMRIFCGLLASARGQFVLSGDEYLNARPMKRVIEPLNAIGADIKARQGNNLAPIVIRGADLAGFDYESSVSSAQVKTCLILAGLFANGVCYFKEPSLSRDHTERMLLAMGAGLDLGEKIKITPLAVPLKPLDITIPADPSSAFFFAVLAAVKPGAKVKLAGVSLNKTRIKAFEILEAMGAKITYDERAGFVEPIGDITVCGADLSGVCVEDDISWLIDEIPALAVAFAFAKGKSTVKNAAELRVKESDRIAAIVSNLNACGISASASADGFSVTGGEFSAGDVRSYGDHRIVMSFAIAGFYTPGLSIDDETSFKTSFPTFFKILQDLGGNIIWK